MPRLGPENFIATETFEISGQKGPSLDSDLTTIKFIKGENLSLSILLQEGCFTLTNKNNIIYVQISEFLLNTFRKRNPSIKQILETQSQIECSNDHLFLVISKMLGDEEDYSV